MLDAMMMALNEMLAGEGPMGVSDEENERIMRDMDKAADWVAQEERRRAQKSCARKAKV
jgi:hypothetical protein